MSVAKVMGILSFTTVVQLYNCTMVRRNPDRMTARRKEVLALDWDLDWDC